MAKKIIMPKQGLQMTDGIITQWFAAEGDVIEEGQPLFEMETDKLTITIDASASGTLLKILSQPGEVVPITQTIAIVGEPGEDISSLLNEANASPSSIMNEAAQAEVIPSAPTQEEEKRIFATPRARTRAEERDIALASLSGSGPEGLIIERDVLNAPKPKASPLARREAELSGVDLNAVSGSGARGKIMADDVRAAKKGAFPPQQAECEAEDTVIPLTGMRRIIAQRMHDSLTELAQANHRMEVDMTESVRVRESLKAAGIKVSYNDLVIRCTAKALTEFPMMNASLTDQGIVLHRRVHIGIAVATDDGLLVPVLQNADTKTLSEISNISHDLSRRTREKALSPDELTGGTFTVTNLGMFGVDSFTAIINAPEAGILAVGQMKKRPVVLKDDSIAVRPMMWLSLTYDHRIVDGAPAAQFLARIKALLENPALLL